MRRYDAIDLTRLPSTLPLLLHSCHTTVESFLYIFPKKPLTHCAGSNDGRHFRQHIRAHNNAFALTSLDVKVDNISYSPGVRAIGVQKSRGPSHVSVTCFLRRAASPPFYSFTSPTTRWPARRTGDMQTGRALDFDQRSSCPF